MYNYYAVLLILLCLGLLVHLLHSPNQVPRDIIVLMKEALVNLRQHKAYIGILMVSWSYDSHVTVMWQSCDSHIWSLLQSHSHIRSRAYFIWNKTSHVIIMSCHVTESHVIASHVITRLVHVHVARYSAVCPACGEAWGRLHHLYAKVVRHSTV